MLLAIVNKLAGAPRHSEHALVDGEHAVNKRDVVVGVSVLGLRQVQSIAALAHVVAIFAIDLDALKRFARDEFARSDIPRKHGVSLAVGLGSVLGGDRNRARLDLERDLTLGGRTVNRHLVSNGQRANVADLGGLGGPVLAVSAVLCRCTLGQTRRIDRVIRTVVLIGIANDSGSRNFDLGQLVTANFALLLLGSLLGCRGSLDDDPLKVVLGLVDLVTTGALMPMRAVVGEPLIVHGLVLAHALDRDDEVALGVLNGELATRVGHHNDIVDLDGIRVVVSKVAALDTDREGG